MMWHVFPSILCAYQLVMDFRQWPSRMLDLKDASLPVAQRNWRCEGLDLDGTRIHPSPRDCDIRIQYITVYNNSIWVG